jgi:hypothetical protein
MANAPYVSGKAAPALTAVCTAVRRTELMHSKSERMS